MFSLKNNPSPTSVESEDVNDSTPNDNEATEKCPLCERLNNPGALDTCEHFFGMQCEGDIIWSDKYVSFEESYSAFIDTRDQLENLSPSRVTWLINQIVREEFITGDLIKASSWLENSPTKIIKEIMDFKYGLVVETDGMLSSVGRSLYHHNPGLVGSIIDSYELLTRKLKEYSEQKNNGKP